ncbi:MAG: HAD family hydrolase [Desulfuromonadales bacterium]
MSCEIPKTKFQYIFWDNDGVLVDTERHYLQANREALAKVSISLSDLQFADISLKEGRSIFDLASVHGLSGRTIGELRTWRNARYAELLEQHELPLAGVREVLGALHGRIDMAIVTSSLKSHFDIIHKRSDLLRFFNFYLTREDYATSKPAAESYLLALLKSGQRAQHVLVIEDSPRGLAAAKAAGLTCWVIPGHHTSQQDFQGADRILLSIEEIPKLLL